jgi:hypothetical protein
MFTREMNEVRNYFDNDQLFAAFKQLPTQFQRSIAAVFKTLPGANSSTTDAVMAAVYGAALGATGKDPRVLGLLPKGYERSGTIPETFKPEDETWFHNLDLGYTIAKKLADRLRPEEAFKAAMPEIEKAAHAVNPSDPRTLKDGLLQDYADPENQGYLSNVSDEVLKTLPSAGKAVADSIQTNSDRELLNRKHQPARSAGSRDITTPNHRVRSNTTSPSPI